MDDADAALRCGQHDTVLVAAYQYYPVMFCQRSAGTRRDRWPTLVVATTTTLPAPSKIAACAARMTSASKSVGPAVGRPFWRRRAQNSAASNSTSVVTGRYPTLARRASRRRTP